MRAVRARLLISLGFGVGVTKVPSRFTVMDVGPSLTRRGVSSGALMHHDKVRLSWLSSECRGSQCRLGATHATTSLPRRSVRPLSADTDAVSYMTGKKRGKRNSFKVVISSGQPS